MQTKIEITSIDYTADTLLTHVMPIIESLNNRGFSVLLRVGNNELSFAPGPKNFENHDVFILLHKGSN